MRGLSFRGVHLTPEPAYASRQQIFVEGAPFQFPNALFSEALGGYGKVSQVKHLPVKGHPHIQSGTRMVTMSVTKDIPVFVTIAGFRCKVWYRGQPITCFGCGKTGHVISACPNRGRPQSFAAAVNPAQVAAQSSESPESVAGDPSLDPTPSDNEATTNQASASMAADNQQLKNAAPSHKSKKAKKGKSAPSKAKDSAPPSTSRGDKATLPSWPQRSVLENADGGLSVMVPVSHDHPGSEPEPAHSVDDNSIVVVTVEQSGSFPPMPESATCGRTVVEDGNTITITIPALPALDLPPVTLEEHETEVDMAVKGQKRLRNRDDSDSGDEVDHKTVRDITGDRVPTTSASSTDLPDTTVAVHLDPDTEPPEATASSVGVADTVSVPPEAAAPTVDAAADTTSVHSAAGTADVATDGSVPPISGSPTMVERFAAIAESLSSEDSENLPVPSSARPEAVVSLTTVAVSEDAASTTVANTAAASSSSDETTSVDESDEVPTTIWAPPFVVGVNPLAQLRLALQDLEDFTPSIEIRPSSLDDSTEAESVHTISHDSPQCSPASLRVESSDSEWYVPGHDVWPDSGCSTPPFSSGSDGGDRTPSPPATPATLVGVMSPSSSLPKAACSSEVDIPPGDTASAERKRCGVGAEKPLPGSSQ